MGGARLYRSQTARVNAPVRPLIASGPQFHLLVRGADPEPVRIRTGLGSGPIRGLRRHTVRHFTVQQSHSTAITQYSNHTVQQSHSTAIKQYSNYYTMGTTIYGGIPG